MGFPTVKSDPWKKRRTTRHRLWSTVFWINLCDIAASEWMLSPDSYQMELTSRQVRLIGDINEWMYGSR